METIILSENPASICQRHEWWPLHGTDECEKLDGTRGGYRRLCSVCDERWDASHLHCGSVGADGRRTMARARLFVVRHGTEMEIERR